MLKHVAAVGSRPGSSTGHARKMLRSHLGVRTLVTTPVACSKQEIESVLSTGLPVVIIQPVGHPWTRFSSVGPRSGGLGGLRQPSDAPEGRPERGLCRSPWRSPSALLASGSPSGTPLRPGDPWLPRGIVPRKVISDIGARELDARSRGSTFRCVARVALVAPGGSQYHN